MTTPDFPSTLTATVSNLVARLTGPRPLVYATRAPDLPPHVRAGSALRAWRGGLVVVQDDVRAVAFLATPTGSPVPVRLPSHPDERFRGWVTGAATASDDVKATKRDFEAAVVLPDGRLVLFGSGSTPRRMCLVVFSADAEPEIRFVDATPFYTELCNRKDFSGSQLNLEGVVVIGASLRLFQRGNGAPVGDLEPVNAVGDLSLEGFVAWLDAGGPVPELEAVARIELGNIDGVPLTFTDAAALDDGRAAFLGCAEASADTYQDGPVSGTCIGVMNDDGSVTTTRITLPDGSPNRLKLEGLEYLGRDLDGALRFVVVADPDDAHTPAVIADLRWGAAP